MLTVIDMRHECSIHPTGTTYQIVKDEKGNIVYDQDLPLRMQVERESGEAYPLVDGNGKILVVHATGFINFVPLMTKKGIVYIKLLRTYCHTEKEVPYKHSFCVKMERHKSCNETCTPEHLDVNTIDEHLSKMESVSLDLLIKVQKNNAAALGTCATRVATNLNPPGSL